MRVLWTAVPALAALVATGLAASAAPTSLAPHRVVYDLSLAKATGTRGVENARGRIAFDCHPQLEQFAERLVVIGREHGVRIECLGYVLQLAPRDITAAAVDRFQ